jgi:predicted lipoprotein
MKNTWLFLSLVAVIFFSCKKENEPDLKEEFDKNAMLTNYAQRVIQPRYDQLSVQLSLLQAEIDSFTSVSTSQNFSELKEAFRQTYLSWQGVSFIEFGPADNYALKAAFNIFPVDTQQINQNISSGSYVLGSASNISAIGLPAMDYLLNRGNSETQSLNYFTTVDSANRKKYLIDLANQLITSLNPVANQWANSYASTFINSDGTSQGSSVSNMINALNLDFEKYIRDGKVGIPLGIRSLGTPLPEKSEGFFGRLSTNLLRESISQLQSYFNGGSGIGLDDYLNHLEAMHGSELLASKINNQFSAIIQKIDLVTSPIGTAVTSNKPAVQEIYNEMQKMVVLLKVDLSSALSVLITYQDNDGD